MAEAVRGRIIAGNRPRRRRGLAPFAADDPRLYVATPFFAAALRRSALQTAALAAAGAAGAVALGVSLRPFAAGLAGAAAVAVVLAKLRARRAERVVRYEPVPAKADLAPLTPPAHGTLLAPVAADGAVAAALLAGVTHPHSLSRTAAIVMWAPALGATVVLAMLAYTVGSCVLWERRRRMRLLLPCGAGGREAAGPVIYTRPA
jgi:hypothetical protein